MKIPRRDIVAALAAKLDAAGGGATASSQSALAREIAAFLLESRRTGELESLLRDIREYRASRGVVEVVAIIASPLTPATRSDITARIRAEFPGATEVIISEQIDPSVIAGVKLELANSRIDLSARTKLNRLKQLTAAR